MLCVCVCVCVCFCSLLLDFHVCVVLCCVVLCCVVLCCVVLCCVVCVCVCRAVATQASDVYSFGIICWELISRELPFKGSVLILSSLLSLSPSLTSISTSLPPSL